MDSLSPAARLEGHSDNGTLWRRDDRSLESDRPAVRIVPSPAHSSDGLVGAVIARIGRSYHACVGCSIFAGVVVGAVVWYWMLA